jgi:hypothetical protein
VLALRWAVASHCTWSIHGTRLVPVTGPHSAAAAAVVTAGGTAGAGGVEATTVVGAVAVTGTTVVTGSQPADGRGADDDGGDQRHHGGGGEQQRDPPPRSRRIVGVGLVDIIGAVGAATVTAHDDGDLATGERRGGRLLGRRHLAPEAAAGQVVAQLLIHRARAVVADHQTEDVQPAVDGRGGDGHAGVAGRVRRLDHHVVAVHVEQRPDVLGVDAGVHRLCQRGALLGGHVLDADGGGGGFDEIARHPLDVPPQQRLHEGPVGAVGVRCQPGRGVAAVAQLRHPDRDGARRRGEDAAAVAVAAIHPLAAGRAATGVDLDGHELFGERPRQRLEQPVILAEPRCDPVPRLVGQRVGPFRRLLVMDAHGRAASCQARATPS